MADAELRDAAVAGRDIRSGDVMIGFDPNNPDGEASARTDTLDEVIAKVYRNPPAALTPAEAAALRTLLRIADITPSRYVVSITDDAARQVATVTESRGGVISAIEIDHSRPYRGQWTNNREYDVGSIVSDAGGYWLCAATGNTSHRPSADSPYWALLRAEDVEADYRALSHRPIIEIDRAYQPTEADHDNDEVFKLGTVLYHVVGHRRVPQDVEWSRLPAGYVFEEIAPGVDAQYVADAADQQSISAAFAHGHVWFLQDTHTWIIGDANEHAETYFPPEWTRAYRSEAEADTNAHLGEIAAWPTGDGVWHSYRATAVTAAQPASWQLQPIWPTSVGPGPAPAPAGELVRRVVGAPGGITVDDADGTTADITLMRPRGAWNAQVQDYAEWDVVTFAQSGHTLLLAVVTNHALARANAPSLDRPHTDTGWRILTSPDADVWLGDRLYTPTWFAGEGRIGWRLRYPTASGGVVVPHYLNADRDGDVLATAQAAKMSAAEQASYLADFAALAAQAGVGGGGPTTLRTAATMLLSTSTWTTVTDDDDDDIVVPALGSIEVYLEGASLTNRVGAVASAKIPCSRLRAAAGTESLELALGSNRFAAVHVADASGHVLQARLQNSSGLGGNFWVQIAHS